MSPGIAKAGFDLIHQRAALRELTTTATAVFVVLMSVLLTTQLIRLLGQAAGGKVVPGAVVSLLGFGALGYLAVLFSLTLYLAVLLTFSRWYRDSEMAIWMSSGLSLTYWIRTVLRFGWPVFLLVAVLSLWLAPWAAQRSETYRKQIEQRDDAARVSPGAFNESAGGERVFFVESVAEDGTSVGNVFVAAEKAGELLVIGTSTGHVEVTDEGDRYLVLEGGRRYDTVPGSAAYRMMEFARYGMRIDTADASGASLSLRTADTTDLFRQATPRADGELLWRIGVPISAVVMALLAVPLSFVNPRGGRANNIVVAILLYLIYNNLMNISQAWVSQGKITLGLGVVGVHATMIAVAFVLFARREMPAGLWHRLRWR